jgi:hypothetical protein
MNVRKIAVVMALAAVWVIGLGGISRAQDAQATLYTKYNMHIQMEVSNKGERIYQASYTGWVDPGRRHEILPPNSKIMWKRLPEPVWDKWNPLKKFLIVVMDPNEAGVHADKIVFELHVKNMAMPIDEYVNFITSPTPVSLDGLSAKDMEGVREGKVSEGMTKKGVMTAWGYPASHRTPNPDENSIWTYWENRAKAVDVYFDPKGRVQHLSY